MSDRWIVSLAIAAGLGALCAIPVPVVVALWVLMLALLCRWKFGLCIAMAALVSAISHHGWAELDRPLSPNVSRIATLVRDPQTNRQSVHAEVRLDDGRHVDLWARGESSVALQSASAGDRVSVNGVARPLSGLGVAALRRRHIAARVQADSMQLINHGTAMSRLANAMRLCLERGSISLSFDQRALLRGFVLGDVRGESSVLSNDFRQAGLAHLLAVSGENVAFMLIVAGPVLRRLPLISRYVAGLMVLGLFGVVTRWEPSVVRAEAMAVVVLTALFLGRRVSPIRCLSLAVTACLIADPFLVGSIGFLLSVSACTGMALLGRRISHVMSSPSSSSAGKFARVVGYGLAAQLGVAPVSAVVFGGLPLVGVPANLLAEPAAGAVMVWGVTGGMLAGLLGGTAASVLQFPTGLLLDWIAFVAHYATGLGWGMWTPMLAWLGAAAMAARLWWQRHPARNRSRPDTSTVECRE